jgi:hypothetical protein
MRLSMQRIRGSPCGQNITTSPWSSHSCSGCPFSGLSFKAVVDVVTDPGRFQQMQQSTAERQPETAGQALAGSSIAPRYPANAGRPSEPGVPDRSGEADVTRSSATSQYGGRMVENRAHQGTAAAFLAFNGHQLARKRRANPTMGKLEDGTIEMSGFGLGLGRFGVQITAWGMG